VFGYLLGPLVASGTAALSAVLGSSEQTAHRLRQAGLEIGVPEFRSQQLAWGAIGAGAGLVLSVVIARSSEVPVLMAVVIVAVGAASGVVLRDYVLQRAARARLSRMADELPTVLEFLTLSLSSGEGILDALTRVARISSGELSGELAGVIRGVRTGLPLGESLTRLADDLQLPALSRCIEQLTGALDRGTPLAEVLRAQAQDSREESKRELLELAGKKEVAMLVPLVFLILPLTIFFAIFPGIVVLQMGF
jgi:tight adherence protein C